MKKPFEVGDRVRVYGGYLKMDGISSHGHCDVTIAKIESETSLMVEQQIADGRMKTWFCHPKQCRRIVKRKRREIWLIEYSDGKLDDCCFRVDPTKDTTRKYVRFIEAKEK